MTMAPAAGLRVTAILHAAIALSWIVALAGPNLLAMPVWPWAQVRPIASRDSLLELLLLDGSLQASVASVVISLLVLAAVRRVDVLLWIAFPFAILLPVEAWYVVRYGQPSGSHVLGVVAETNLEEAGEFLSATLGALVLAMAVAGATAYATIRYARRRDLRWAGRSRDVWLAVVLGTGAVVGVQLLAEHPPAADAKAAAPTTQHLAVERQNGIDRFGEVFPWGLTVRVADYALQRRAILTAADDLRAFRFGAAAQATHPITIVLVIGESLRADRLGLNGYRRQTTPYLAAVEGLVSFADAVVATPATRTSVPQMLSRQRPGIDAVERLLPERSVLSAFKEAGFATWWISNQMTVGRHDNAIAVIGAEADRRRYLNGSSYGARSGYDGVLVDELAEVLASPAERKFVVLHTLGSHFNYRNRYPDEFDRFVPSLGREEPVTPFDRHKKESIRNAYDNSVLYTDFVLTSMVRRLEAAGGRSVLLYVSDHGQALFDGMCTNTGHGMLSATNFHVPLLVWFSERMRAERSDAWSGLLANRASRVTTESVFPTLLDVASIRFAGDKRELSLANAAMQRGTRWVTADARSWVDYDRELPARDCAQVGPAAMRAAGGSRIK